MTSPAFYDLLPKGLYKFNVIVHNLVDALIVMFVLISLFYILISVWMWIRWRTKRFVLSVFFFCSWIYWTVFMMITEVSCKIHNTSYNMMLLEFVLLCGHVWLESVKFFLNTFIQCIGELIWYLILNCVINSSMVCLWTQFQFYSKLVHSCSLGAAKIVL